MVDPNHQKKGIGTKLLADVVAKSDEERIPTYIVSSFESHGLYAKLGFEDLEEFPIDNEYWARQIEETELGLGITDSKGLAEKCQGMREVDTGMIRWPR
jgi:N-acetylglutamate synthase-like GNAT family acetyltransferase